MSKESYESFLHFLTNVCAIVGGTLSILTISNRKQVLHIGPVQYKRNRGIGWNCDGIIVELQWNWMKLRKSEKVELEWKYAVKPFSFTLQPLSIPSHYSMGEVELWKSEFATCWNRPNSTLSLFQTCRIQKEYYVIEASSLHFSTVLCICQTGPYCSFL